MRERNITIKRDFYKFIAIFVKTCLTRWNVFKNMKKLLLSAIGFLLITLSLSAQELISLEGTAATVRLQDGKIMTVDFYGPDIVRVFLDPAGGPVRDPQATPPAKILVNNPRRDAGDLLSMPFGDDAVWINSDDIDLVISADGSFRFRHHIPAMRTMDPYQDIWRQARVEFTPTGTTLTLPGNEVADYYGGGIQNGRYRHNGKTIAIENQNSWTDGGVCSPAPWFWCTDGYGILWHTFAKGSYRFGEEVVLQHDTPYLDIFLMLADDPLQYPSVLELIPGATKRGFLEPSGQVLAELPARMLKLYYQLTGAPVLLPKFGFYEGHLNAYNRDYWTETTEEGKGIPFEDGKRYVESQKDNGGIRESLNGELPGNYQFSARSVIDRYEAADMPLGWILPNDGYGAGYGQTETLAGNVQNLKEFGDYARSKGVEIGLWTQSDLHPIDTLPALLQRDILAEVRDAGVRVLKTDVAWVGWGYSFGLNGITDAAEIMTKYGADARPFIITLDGWAGTQRYAGVWSGDQVGGNWEYIRFHIPTYLCAGLSGQPNITSDMDGIFGGKNEAVNIRDFQWKTFTPMQLNMDGWGSNEKYPQALGTRAADINRRYLKLKSELMPYAYSIAREAVTGDPMIRSMEFEDPAAKKVATTQYQFLYGPSLLVAPIYQNTEADADGNDIRNGIYLPEGLWLDYWTSEAYLGGRVINGYDAPLDKLPVFLRSGAIIPMTAPHNNPSQQAKSLRIYDIAPSQRGSSFVEYDDDGRTTAYLDGAFATTEISQDYDEGDLLISIEPTQGSFEGMVKQKGTLLRIRTAGKPKKVVATIDGKKVKVVKSYDAATRTLSLMLPFCDVTANTIDVTLKGFQPIYASATSRPTPEETTFCLSNPAPEILPSTPTWLEPVVTSTSIDLRWEPVAEADCYRIDFNGMVYDNIKGGHLLFEGLSPDTEYEFNIRSLEDGWPSFAGFKAVRTAADPILWAIRGVQATCSAPAQPGQDLKNFFDLDMNSEVWHTRWGEPAVPFTLELDLGAIYTLDKMDYYPRTDAGNGTLLEGTVCWSRDGAVWSEPQPFQWKRDNSVKSFGFEGTPQVRFVRISVTRATGAFGSGRELLIYRVPGTEGFKGGVFNERGEAVEKVE